MKAAILRAAIFVFVCAVSNFAFAQRAWRTPGEADAATARRFASEGRCADALALFDDAVEARAEDAPLRRDRGLCHERLGHPAPAIEDYRAYLSMQPTAPDAGPIRARLDALERAEPEAPPALRGSPEAGAAPSSEADRDSADVKRKPSLGLPEPGDFFLGFHLGERGWSEKGFAVPTVAYGVAGGFAYATALELEARLVLLRTNVLHTTGYGAAVGNAFKLALDSARRWELGLALGVGYENQSNDLGVARKYVFGTVSPRLRFMVSGPIALEAAPEVGMGALDQGDVNVLTGDDTTAMAFFYGGYVRFSWLIRGERSEP